MRDVDAERTRRLVEARRTRPLRRFGPVLGALLTGSLSLAPALGEAQGGDGRVRCEVTENGAAAAGSLVVRKDGSTVAEGRCDGGLRVPPGAYDVEVRLDGALDRPSEARSITVRPGASETVRVAFETGSITVEVAAGGRAAAAFIELKKGGRTVGRLSAGVSARVSVGAYEVVVRHLHGDRRESVTVTRGGDAVVRVALD